MSFLLVHKNVIMLNVIVFIRYLMLLNHIKAHTLYSTILLNCIENFTYIIVEILMQEVICSLNTTLSFSFSFSLRRTNYYTEKLFGRVPILLKYLRKL